MVYSTRRGNGFRAATNEREKIMNAKIITVKTETITPDYRDVMLVKNTETGKFAALQKVDGRFTHDNSVANSPEYTTVDWVSRPTAIKHFKSLVEIYTA